MTPKLKDLPKEELLHKGNLACAGCPEMVGFRHVLRALGENTIVINATGCLAVITTKPNSGAEIINRYPPCPLCGAISSRHRTFTRG